MSLSASFSAPPSKRPRLNTDEATTTTTRSHKRRRLAPIARQKIHPGTASILPEDAVRAMMDQSIGLVLKSYGFDGAAPIAMEEIRQRADSYFREVVNECMVFARAQRRSRPTILDCVETLKRMRCTPGDCESEIDRYRSATNPTTTTTTTTTKPSRVFEVPRPPPSPPPSPDLQKLLGPDLLPPKLPQRRNNNNDKGNGNGEPRRDYIDDFLPSLPSRHTYVATPVFMERPTDPREIRELAMEESRVGGETLRRMLASVAKCSASGTGSMIDASKLKDERTIALAITGRGDSRRRKRDAAWQAAWDGLTAAKEKQKADAAELANGLLTLEDGDSAIGDDERPKGSSDDRQWWMDGIVNSEKDFFRKGVMKRILKTPVVLV